MLIYRNSLSLVKKFNGPGHVLKCFLSKYEFTGVKDLPVESIEQKISSEIKAQDVSLPEDEELQPYWKAMESRVSRRKPRVIQANTPHGRSERIGSAWDAEHV